MIARTDREDTAAQQEAVTRARTALSDALAALAAEATRAHKAARTRTGQPDLPAVYAAESAVRRAEEALDTACYDLHTARGGDG